MSTRSDEVTAEEIRQLIQRELPEAKVTVRGDDGRHFDAEVVWSGFSGQSMIAQHQAVYSALGDRMGREIHALQLRTRAS